MLTLLTCTGARPEAWANCQRLMRAQDYAGPVRWVIVDDGPEAMPVTFEREGWQLILCRPDPLWQPGQNTQCRNMLEGLRVAGSGARLVIIEDDDWYSPGWLTTIARELESCELVGEMRARYYNVQTRIARQLRNDKHASLCATALRGRALETLRWVCDRGSKFIDLDLWKKHKPSRLISGNRVVGIKGLPGRGGIGMGHRADLQGDHDTDGAILRAWIGSDAELYQ